MSENEGSDDTPDDGTGSDEANELGEEVPVRVEGSDVEDQRGGADRAVEQFDETVIDLLSWVLDTETRARIYVYLRQHPGSTSGEVAEGTGLYPSTVREALAALNGEEKVSRRKRQSGGAGNNPYEYTAIAPSELVGGVVGQIQDELNTVFNLDRRLGRGAEGDRDPIETGPVTINVDEEPDGNEGDDGDGAGDRGPTDAAETGDVGTSDGVGTGDEADTDGDVGAVDGAGGADPGSTGDADGDGSANDG